MSRKRGFRWGVDLGGSVEGEGGGGGIEGGGGGRGGEGKGEGGGVGEED